MSNYPVTASSGSSGLIPGKPGYTRNRLVRPPERTGGAHLRSFPAQEHRKARASRQRKVELLAISVHQKGDGKKQEKTTQNETQRISSTTTWLVMQCSHVFDSQWNRVQHPKPKKGPKGIKKGSKGVKKGSKRVNKGQQGSKRVNKGQRGSKGVKKGQNGSGKHQCQHTTHTAV